MVIDPLKPPADKGKQLYPSDSLLGNKYLTLIAECLMKWAEKHPLTNQHSPTKFVLALKNLTDKGVQLPTEYRYFED
jgi:hypothetical protein